jgi:hypothetical protein
MVCLSIGTIEATWKYPVGLSEVLTQTCNHSTVSVEGVSFFKQGVKLGGLSVLILCHDLLQLCSLIL